MRMQFTDREDGGGTLIVLGSLVLALGIGAVFGPGWAVATLGAVMVLFGTLMCTTPQ